MGKNKRIEIKIDTNFFVKGDVIQMDGGPIAVVKKIKKSNWWKRFLSWLGFKIDLSTRIECEIIGHL